AARRVGRRCARPRAAPGGVWRGCGTDLEPDSVAFVARSEEYALIGDLQTAALGNRDGSIDWCCFPRFDSGACFAALLGGPEHGRWLVAPGRRGKVTRRYRSDTLILETVFESDAGAVRVIDFMPPRGRAPDIVRIVEGLSGVVAMRVELVIRFDFGRILPWMRRVDDARVAIAGPDALCLRAPVEVRGRDMTTVAEFTVTAGERIPFALTWFPSHEDLPAAIDAERALTDSEEYWLGWGRAGDRVGDYHDEVHRSLVVLKALTYAPTGGIVAAPTTSLPEAVGGGAQLGLPLLLASRYDAHAACDAADRSPGGGRGLGALAPTSGR